MRVRWVVTDKEGKVVVPVLAPRSVPFWTDRIVLEDGSVMRRVWQ